MSEWRTDFLDFEEQIFLICKWLDNRRTDFLDFERTGRTGRTGEQIFRPSLLELALRELIIASGTLKPAPHKVLGFIRNLAKFYF